MAFLPAGVIDGARTPAEQVRRVAYAAAGGRTGVVAPGDLRVSALAAPGGAVVVGPGSAFVVSTYPGAAGQAYVISNDANVTVPVPANTTGSPVTRHIVASIRDPQYAGMPAPSDPLSDVYLDIAAVLTLPTDRPYLLLGSVTLPASSSAVTSAMVTNVAQAMPMELSTVRVHFPGTDVVMSKTAYANWAGSPLTYAVPSWATRVIAVAHINGVEYKGSSPSAGVAGVRMLLGGTPTSQNGIVGARQAGRQSIVVAGEWNLGPGVAGTSQAVLVQAYQTAGSGTFEVDYQSQVVTQVTFQRVT